MTILRGGAFGSGLFEFVTNHSVNCPTWKANPSYRPFCSYVQLDADPLGRPYHVLKTKINQSAYDSGAAAPTYTLRSEVIALAGAWGNTYTYYWRIVIPPSWVSLGPGSSYVIGQLHETTGKAGTHYPAVSFQVLDKVCNVMHALDSNYPNPEIIFSFPVSPGLEVELFARVRWADGLPGDPDASTYGHVAAAEGIFEWSLNGVQTYTRNGVLNTWKPSALHSDDSPPFQICGTYQPTNDASWWIGKEMHTYHVAMVMGDGVETNQTMRDYVNAQLAEHCNKPRILHC